MHHGRPSLIVHTLLPKLYVVVSEIARLDILDYMNGPPHASVITQTQSMRNTC